MSSLVAWLGAMRRRIVSHNFIRSTGVLVGGTAAGQAILLVVAPIITRLYAPVDYGTLAAFTAILFALLPIAALRFELTVPLVETEDDAAVMIALSGVALLATVAVTALLVPLVGEPLAAWANAPALSTLLWLVPAGVLLGGGYNVLTHWAIRKREFGAISRSALSRPLGKAATQVGLGLLQAGPLGLIAGEVVGQAGGTLPLLRRSGREIAERVPRVRRRSLGIMARRYWRFPVLTGSSTLLGSAASHGAPLLVAGLFGAQAAGWLALCLRVLTMPLSLLGSAVGKVYLSRAGDLAGRNHADLRRLFLRTALVLLAAGLLPALVLLLAGPSAFAVVFGEEWREAGRYARLLAPMLLSEFVMAPLTHTLDLLQQQKAAILWHVARLAVLAGAFLIPHSAGFGAGGAIAAYGLGMTALYALLFGLTLQRIESVAPDPRPDPSGRPDRDP